MLSNLTASQSYQRVCFFNTLEQPSDILPRFEVPELQTVNELNEYTDDEGPRRMSYCAPILRSRGFLEGASGFGYAHLVASSCFQSDQYDRLGRVLTLSLDFLGRVEVHVNRFGAISDDFETQQEMRVERSHRYADVIRKRARPDSCCPRGDTVQEWS